jgi:hypothetical protein
MQERNMRRGLMNNEGIVFMNGLGYRPAEAICEHKKSAFAFSKS